MITRQIAPTVDFEHQLAERHVGTAQIKELKSSEQRLRREASSADGGVEDGQSIEFPVWYSNDKYMPFVRCKPEYCHCPFGAPVVTDPDAVGG